MIPYAAAMPAVPGQRDAIAAIHAAYGPRLGTCDARLTITALIAAHLDDACTVVRQQARAQALDADLLMTVDHAAGIFSVSAQTLAKDLVEGVDTQSDRILAISQAWAASWPSSQTTWYPMHLGTKRDPTALDWSMRTIIANRSRPVVWASDPNWIWIATIIGPETCALPVLTSTLPLPWPPGLPKRVEVQPGLYITYRHRQNAICGSIHSPWHHLEAVGGTGAGALQAHRAEPTRDPSREQALERAWTSLALVAQC